MFPRQLKYTDAAYLLYPEDSDVSKVIEDHDFHNILCLSDTNETVVAKYRSSDSIAVNIERQLESKDDDTLSWLNITQTDYHSAEGAHLPQKKNQPRREYSQIDNSKLKLDQQYDLILGKSLMCCCSNIISCGGIRGNHSSQEKFIKSLIEATPNLIVLSSNQLSDESIDRFYIEGKNQLKSALENLSLFYDGYDFIFIDQFLKSVSNLRNSGHLVIIAKRDVVSLVDLPETAMIFRQESSVLKLSATASHLMLFWDNQYPRAVVITDADNKKIVSLKIDPSYQEELYRLRNIVGKDIIKKTKNNPVYEINVGYLKVLEAGNSNGFAQLAKLLGMFPKSLSSIVQKDSSGNDSIFAGKSLAG